MYSFKPALFAAIASCTAALAGAADEPSASQVNGPYETVAGWLKPVGMGEGRVIYPLSVFAQSRNRVFIANGGTSLLKPGTGMWKAEYPEARSDHKLFVVDRNGKVIEDWSQWQDLLKWPERVRINPYDPEKHVWVVDRDQQQIFKFTNDGKRLVMTLGERGVAGSDRGHFGGPTDIAWLPDGTFFVSDGYNNARVVKFDKNGRYLLEWGSKGTGAGQFDLVHGIAIGPDREVYVVDRDNQRIQVFDENGNFKRQWKLENRPVTVIVDAQRNAWILQGHPDQRLSKHDAEGKQLSAWGDSKILRGAHDLSIDSEGAIYISMAPIHTVNRYVPRTDADKAELVGQPYVAAADKSQR